MTTHDLESAWLAVEATVRGYLHRRLQGDAATADDLAQEVFLRVRRGLGELREVGSLGPWVLRIARSVLIDHLRRMRPPSALPTEELVAGPGPQDDPEELAALAAYLRHQVDDLPVHEAAALRLVDLDGVPPDCAAQMLGLGLSALKARLRRGRQRLRRAIEACCAIVLDGRGHPTGCEPRAGCVACIDTHH